mgnify:CR=1 FL=1
MVSEVTHLSSFHTIVEEIHECVARDVANRSIRLISQDSLADSLKKVCLAKANSTVNEVWVVGPSWFFGYSRRCHKSKSVSRPNHKVFKDIIITNKSITSEKFVDYTIADETSYSSIEKTPYELQEEFFTKD